MTVNEPRTEPDNRQPTIYQIRLKGHLSQARLDWFEGLTITLEEEGNTLLTGTIVDQAALHGVLKKVRDLGMPLLAINSVPSGIESDLSNELFRPVVKPPG